MAYEFACRGKPNFFNIRNVCDCRWHTLRTMSRLNQHLRSLRAVSRYVITSGKIVYQREKPQLKRPILFWCVYSFKTLIWCKCAVLTNLPKLCTFSNYLLGTNMLLKTLIWIVISAEPAWGQWPAWRSSCNTWQSEGTYF